MKKLICTLLVVAMIAVLLPAVVVSGSADLWDGVAEDISWYDESKTEFTITTCAQFAGLRKLVNGYQANAESTELTKVDFKDKTVKLGADLDLNNKDWTPIGIYVSATESSFKGTFDGQDHEIANLSLTYSASTFEDGTSEKALKGIRLGLFGILNGTVKNLKLVGAHVTNPRPLYSAFIAGMLEGGTIENVSIDATSSLYTDSGTSQGAFAGRSTQNATIKNCENRADIIGKYVYEASKSWNILNGGIVGYATDTTISYCRNYGKITAELGDITDEFYKAQVSQFAAGGICGFTTNATIVNCANYGEVMTDSSFNDGKTNKGVGGIIGKVHSKDGGIVENCYNFGKVSAKDDVDTFAALILGSAQKATTIKNCYSIEIGTLGVVGKSSESYAGVTVENVVTFKESDTNFDKYKEDAAAMIANASNPQYDFVIHYVYDDNTKAADDITATFYKGDSYKYVSPMILGFSADKETVEGTMGEEAVTVIVTYSKKQCSVTVEYKYDDGKEAAASKTESGVYGTEFKIESPVIEGYKANFETVEGVLEEASRTITVTYKKSAVATTEGSNDDTTPAPADTDKVTDAPTTTTKAPDKQSSGCGSVSVAAIVAAVVMVVGTAIVIKKK